MGRWLYAASVWTTVEVVAFDCDYFFERMLGDDGRTDWAPYSLNEDGLLYYVRAGGGDVLPMKPFLTIAAAKAWVNSQPWGPVEWS